MLTVLMGWWEKAKRQQLTTPVYLAAMACLLVWASYGAWHEQYLKDQSQVTYIEFDPSGKGAPAVPFLEEGKYAAFNFVRLNAGQYRADDSYARGGIEILQAPDDPHADPQLGQGWLSNKALERTAWELFIKRSSSSKGLPAKSVVVPGQYGTTFITALSDHKVSHAEIEKVNSGKNVVYLLALAIWTDAAGTHERRMCRYYHFPIQSGVPNVQEECHSYNDFLPKAVDFQ